MRIKDLPNESLPTSDDKQGLYVPLDSSNEGTNKIALNNFQRLIACSSPTDLNDCLYYGLYRFSPTTANTPTSNTYGLVLVLSTNVPQSSGSGWIIQVAYGTTGQIYSRRKINANNNFTKWILYGEEHEVTSFASLDGKGEGLFNIQYVGADSDAPVTTSDSWFWHVINIPYYHPTDGNLVRSLQIAVCPFRSRETVYFRVKHDSTWYGWFTLRNQNYSALTVSKNGSEIDSADAYVERGVVVLRIIMKAGLSAGWHNTNSISLGDTAYLPRVEVDGARRINAGADSSIASFMTVGSNGGITFYTSGVSSGTQKFTFVYPMRT